MSKALPQGVKTAYLIFGIVESLGAALWCLAGAGIYGSPLADLRGPERTHVLAFLVAGPFSALPAVILALWKPRGGAAWLVAGGLVSGVLAVPYFSTDAGVFPLMLTSLPMLIAGLWLIGASAIARRAPTQPAEPARGSNGEPAHRAGAGSMLLGIALFLAAWVGTFALLIVLTVNNVTGLRGPTLSHNRFVHENENVADAVVLLVLAGGAALLGIVRKRLRLRGEFLAGMWVALLLGGLEIALR